MKKKLKMYINVEFMHGTDTPEDWEHTEKTSCVYLPEDMSFDTAMDFGENLISTGIADSYAIVESL